MEKQNNYRPLNYKPSLKWVNDNIKDGINNEEVNGIKVIIFNNPTWLPYSISKISLLKNIYSKIDNTKKKDLLIQHIVTFAYLNKGREKSVYGHLKKYLSSEFEECDISDKFLLSKIKYDYQFESTLIRKEPINYIIDRESKFDMEDTNTQKTIQTLMTKYRTIKTDIKHDKIIEIYNNYKNEIFNMSDLNKFIEIETQSTITLKNDTLISILKKKNIEYKHKQITIGEHTLNFTTRKEYEYIKDLEKYFKSHNDITSNALGNKHEIVKRFWKKNEYIKSIITSSYSSIKQSQKQEVKKVDKVVTEEIKPLKTPVISPEVKEKMKEVITENTESFEVEEEEIINNFINSKDKDLDNDEIDEEDDFIIEYKAKLEAKKAEEAIKEAAEEEEIRKKLHISKKEKESFIWSSLNNDNVPKSNKKIIKKEKKHETDVNGRIISMKKEEQYLGSALGF
ncbi:hypothetical protein GCQ56_07630 [Marinifilum sp. N1E240]|uniref:hypothetical protein n=1 Tax=Marinifilum sp. N1E240 TaxID=2608082 RepID=UPI00128E2B28|nr:hypothetical protein [Marinifilum sp. N1E240]MPQ46883.1 hypothetical protein [Marinifilum sp. N1E240]